MKRLKKGFTLIELLVVIAIIGILATTLAPKLREQLAKAKDAKAIAILGAARTITGILFVDKMVQTTNGAIGTLTIKNIYDKLDNKAQEITTEAGAVKIGGSGDGTKVVNYGGTISLNTPTMALDGEEVSVTFVTSAAITAGASGTSTHSSEGKAWLAY